jgi:hypothetical protein
MGAENFNIKISTRVLRGKVKDCWTGRVTSLSKLLFAKEIFCSQL